jgi:hypothetical protein
VVESPKAVEPPTPDESHRPVETPSPAPPPPTPPPQQPEFVEACARTCRRLAACGLRPSATCEQSCTSSPDVAACAVNAEDSCNGAASCALANLCHGVGPSGAATCNATFECALRCGADAACACHCGQRMAASYAMAWLTEQHCMATCHGDLACVQTRCSRYILACQANQ